MVAAVEVLYSLVMLVTEEAFDTVLVLEINISKYMVSFHDLI